MWSIVFRNHPGLMVLTREGIDPSISMTQPDSSDRLYAAMIVIAPTEDSKYVSLIFKYSG